MSAVLDGSVAVYGSSGNSVTTGTLTNTYAGDVICVAVTLNTNNAATVGSITATGATFAFRASAYNSPSIGLEYWVGYAAGIFSSAIVVNFTAATTFCTIHAFAFNGTAATNYFDVNASLPATSGAIPADPLSISTTAAATIIVGVFRQATVAEPTATGVFTTIFGGAGNGYMLSEYEIVSTVQSSLSVTAGTGAGDTNGAIADAFDIYIAPPLSVAAPSSCTVG